MANKSSFIADFETVRILKLKNKKTASFVSALIRDFPFQWDSDIEELCTQNFWAKSGISRKKLSCILEKVCVHECLIVVVEFEANK